MAENVTCWTQVLGSPVIGPISISSSCRVLGGGLFHAQVNCAIFLNNQDSTLKFSFKKEENELDVHVSQVLGTVTANERLNQLQLTSVVEGTTERIRLILDPDVYALVKAFLKFYADRGRIRMEITNPPQNPQVTGQGDVAPPLGEE